MSDATKDFFTGLERRGHEPLLEKASGTLGFDLGNGKRTERWLVSLDNGDVTVSHKRGGADCTVRAPKQLFDRVTTGEVNAMAAVLRGAVAVEGDSELLVLFQRLFPSPPAKASRTSRTALGARR